MLRPVLPDPGLDADAVIRGATVALALSAVLTPPALADRRATPSPPTEIPTDGRIVTILSDQRIPTFASPGMPSQLYLSRARARAIVGPDADRLEDIPEDDDVDTTLMPVRSGGGIRVGAVPVRGRVKRIRTAGGTVDVSWLEAMPTPMARPSRARGR